jgi:hypothetical protein
MNAATTASTTTTTADSPEANMATGADEDIVPRALRTWFVIHFWADILFAIPVFFAPDAVLTMAGWTAVDPITARLVAAALFGIGIESLIGRNADANGFLPMLNLKVIWSFTAALGILISMLQGAHDGALFGWLMFAVFAGFHGVWVYWRLRLGKLMQQANCL